ncbi:MAG TPA: ABC transporter ATP-binding protein [Thermomicrobiaceae bacterium]|nr:ABC transporter ATP-binding protein [Thermomicrobiaceae bacterium]
MQPARQESRPTSGMGGQLDAVTVEHLSKRFVRRSLLQRRPVQTICALDDVSFTVRHREIFGILGVNGSGKSTLIRVLSTLLIPDDGLVRIFGLDLRRDEAAVKRLINRVSVEASFFKKLSAMENLLYAVRLYGRGGSGLRRDIEEILVALGLERSRIGQPLEQLSRGMQQKVAIARAFLTSPVLLLLDEPTTGLDPRSKKDVQEFVTRLRDDHDATIILCSHDMDEAERLCDRLAVLDGGRLVAIDTPRGLRRHAAAAAGTLDLTLEETFIHLTGRPPEAVDQVDGEVA